jgi:hypothetical protein
MFRPGTQRKSAGHDRHACGRRWTVIHRREEEKEVAFGNRSQPRHRRHHWRRQLRLGRLPIYAGADLPDDAVGRQLDAEARRPVPCYGTPWGPGPILFSCDAKPGTDFAPYGETCVDASVVFTLPPELPKGTCTLRLIDIIGNNYCSARCAVTIQ